MPMTTNTPEAATLTKILRRLADEIDEGVSVLSHMSVSGASDRESQMTVEWFKAPQPMHPRSTERPVRDDTPKMDEALQAGAKAAQLVLLERIATALEKQHTVDETIEHVPLNDGGFVALPRKIKDAAFLLSMWLNDQPHGMAIYGVGRVFGRGP